MITKKQADTLRMLVEDYAEAYENAQNAGRLAPQDADGARAECVACKRNLDTFIAEITK